jgi:pseudoazurin
MKIYKVLLAISILVGANDAQAETIEVKMLNRGEEGSMIFEPAFLKVNVGDILEFKSVDKGHNVESIKGMLPSGVEKFKSRIGGDFTLPITEEGLYGVKCTPHYAMGMVALIQAGAATNTVEAEKIKHRGKAKKRFRALFNKVSR